MMPSDNTIWAFRPMAESMESTENRYGIEYFIVKAKIIKAGMTLQDLC
jgi:hypothetical protein